MPGRITSSVAFIALLAGLSILGNCSNASAGYLLTNDTAPGDSLFALENDVSEFAAGNQTSSRESAAPQASDAPVPSERPINPMVNSNLLFARFGILGHGGNSSTSGAGSTSNSNNLGGSGPPLSFSMILLVSSPPGMDETVIEANCLPSTSLAMRLFRPPRLS